MNRRSYYSVVNPIIEVTCLFWGTKRKGLYPQIAWEGVEWNFVRSWSLMGSW